MEATKTSCAHGFLMEKHVESQNLYQCGRPHILKNREIYIMFIIYMGI